MPEELKIGDVYLSLGEGLLFNMGHLPRLRAGLMSWEFYHTAPVDLENLAALLSLQERLDGSANKPNVLAVSKTGEIYYGTLERAIVEGEQNIVVDASSSNSSRRINKMLTGDEVIGLYSIEVKTISAEEAPGGP